MGKKIRLKEVAADNWQAVADLELDAAQRDLVADNVYSLAESKFDADARPRAIYAGRRVVGFLMYDVVKGKGRERRASIYRFMVDRRHQGKGYGRAALAAALEEIRVIPRLRRIDIRYMAENAVARAFYGSFGFVEVGRDGDGEVVARLRV
jgi:diamine N-acetyltransferase